MIVTVTMNPAIDKTANVSALEIHGLNRLSNVEVDVGGKGINVSKTICALGGTTIACGFLAGNSGRMIEEDMGRNGIVTDCVWLEGETRTNLKLVEPSGGLTEFNELGPTATPEAIEALARKLEGYAAPGTLFVFAGSVCPGVSPQEYRKLIDRVKAKGARIFLDADDTLFATALEAIPDIVKPNGFELSRYFGQSTEIDDENILIDMARQLNRKGIGLVCVSRGSKGALFISHGSVIRAPGLTIAAHSSVGAGDAMVAALAYGLDQGKTLRENIRLGVATSAGAVMTIGTKPPTIDMVEQLMKQVRLEVLM